MERGKIVFGEIILRLMCNSHKSLMQDWDRAEELGYKLKLKATGLNPFVSFLFIAFFSPFLCLFLTHYNMVLFPAFVWII